MTNTIRASKNYRDLLVWQKAMDLVEAVYAATSPWPRDEQYCLTSQVRRAAVSIPSNIAEGQGRSSSKEFLHHLSMARGSLLEMETQLLLAQRLGYLPTEVVEGLLANSAETSRLLSGLMNSLSHN